MKRRKRQKFEESFRFEGCYVHRIGMLHDVKNSSCKVVFDIVKGNKSKHYSNGDMLKWH
jgi:hypothetical protein